VSGCGRRRHSRLQEVARRFKETVEARDAAEAAQRFSEEGRAALEAEIEAPRAEIAATKAANQVVAVP
jgi:type I restriction enzyme, R subunit